MSLRMAFASLLFLLWALDTAQEVVFPLHESQLQKGLSADPGEVGDNVRCRQDRRSYALRPFHVLSIGGLGTRRHD